jgi:hypothetical protein
MECPPQWSSFLFAAPGGITACRLHMHNLLAHHDSHLRARCPHTPAPPWSVLCPSQLAGVSAGARNRWCRSQGPFPWRGSMRTPAASAPTQAGRILMHTPHPWIVASDSGLSRLTLRTGSPPRHAVFPASRPTHAVHAPGPMLGCDSATCMQRGSLVRAMRRADTAAPPWREPVTSRPDGNVCADPGHTGAGVPRNHTPRFHEKPRSLDVCMHRLIVWPVPHPWMVANVRAGLGSHCSRVCLPQLSLLIPGCPHTGCSCHLTSAKDPILPPACSVADCGMGLASRTRKHLQRECDCHPRVSAWPVGRGTYGPSAHLACKRGCLRATGRVTGCARHVHARGALGGAHAVQHGRALFSGTGLGLPMLQCGARPPPICLPTGHVPGISGWLAMLSAKAPPWSVSLPCLTRSGRAPPPAHSARRAHPVRCSQLARPCQKAVPLGHVHGRWHQRVTRTPILPRDAQVLARRHSRPVLPARRSRRQRVPDAAHPARHAGGGAGEDRHGRSTLVAAVRVPTDVPPGAAAEPGPMAPLCTGAGNGTAMRAALPLADTVVLRRGPSTSTHATRD